ncbi:MAG: glycosyltransferase family 1 protein, partial [Planctomycetota bacterium]
MPQRIGFVSTRFAGTDGVSLESAKWGKVLWDYQHISFWYSGRSDRSPDISYCVPEAFFGHPEVQWINDQVWGRSYRTRKVTERIQRLTEYLKSTFYRFVEQFRIDILIIENALCIPMHIPLGLALTEFLAETELPAIAHHHDFYWERDRFSVHGVNDYLDSAFPPKDPQLQHVVINEAAQEQLSWRKGLTSILVPNVLDFENPAPPPDDYTLAVREDLGLSNGDVMILQPTRVVPRKGIEHAISLVAQLGDPKYKLVISHEAGDEGLGYRDYVQEMAEDANVDLRFVDD